MISDRIELFIDIFLENDNPLVQVFGWAMRSATGARVN